MAAEDMWGSRKLKKSSASHEENLLLEKNRNLNHNYVHFG